MSTTLEIFMIGLRQRRILKKNDHSKKQERYILKIKIDTKEHE